MEKQKFQIKQPRTIKTKCPEKVRLIMSWPPKAVIFYVMPYTTSENFYGSFRSREDRISINGATYVKTDSTLREMYGEKRVEYLYERAR